MVINQVEREETKADPYKQAERTFMRNPMRDSEYG